MSAITPPQKKSLSKLVYNEKFGCFDCLSANFAYVLESYGGNCIQAFGKSWFLDLDIETNSSISEGITQKQRKIFENSCNTEIIWDGKSCLNNVELGSYPVLVLSDGYHLNWTPYHRNKHIEHGYLAYKTVSGVLIVDPYFTDTAWGAMSGYCSEIGYQKLENIPVFKSAKILPNSPLQNHEAEEIEIVGDLNEAKELFEEKLNSYSKLQALVENQESLSIDTWLLLRNRKLLQKFILKQGKKYNYLNHVFSKSILPAWQKARESSYMSLRRVQRGKSALSTAQEDVNYALKIEYELANQISRR